MANKGQQNKFRGNALNRTMHAKTAPIYERAARWADALSTGSFQDVDEMMRVRPGSGSIGGGNTQLQSLTKSGPIRRDKILASPDGTALVLFKGNGGNVVGCAYLQVSGQYITDAKIAVF